LPKGVGSGSSRLRPVLLSLLEDRLLDDPQDVHLACEPSFAAGASVWICAVDKAWLRQHLQALESAGRHVSRIVPEFAPPVVVQQPPVYVPQPAPTYAPQAAYPIQAAPAQGPAHYSR